MANLREEYERIRLEARIREEQELAEFAKSVASMDREKVFGDLEIPPVLTLQAMTPEAYKDIPNPAQYDKEFAEFSTIIGKMNDCINEYCKAGLELYQGFKTLN